MESTKDNADLEIFGTISGTSKERPKSYPFDACDRTRTHQHTNLMRVKNSTRHLLSRTLERRKRKKKQKHQV